MVLPDKNLQKINSLIMDMKEATEELNEISDDFPALNRNLKRILASIKMLEMNVSDILDVEKE